MILKSIYLYIEAPDWPRRERYFVTKSTRYILNYLERAILKPLKFNVDGFNRIVINLTPTGSSELVSTNSERVLCVDIPFLDRIKKYRDGVIPPDVTKELILLGLRLADSYHTLPVEKIEHGLSSFIEQGALNTWQLGKKIIPGIKVELSLVCELNSKCFKLDLLSRKDGILFDRRTVLETDPDEVAFAYKCGDVGLVGDNIVITQKSGSVLSKIPVSELLEEATKQDIA